MIKHRNRTGAGTKDEGKSIGSAEDFKEHVGHVSERVKDAYGQDNGTHKQLWLIMILKDLQSLSG